MPSDFLPITERSWILQPECVDVMLSGVDSMVKNV